MKKSIVVYDSWGELFLNLSPEEAGELIQMMCAYSFGKEYEVTEKGTLFAIFTMIKAKLDEDAEAYEETIKKRSAAGKRGMEKRWNDNTTITNDNNVIEPITNDNTVKQKITPITVSDKDKKKGGRFAPPSLEEVKAYCQERGNKVDPQQFVDFYTSKGWKVGNQPMKDWKAAVRTWETRSGTSPPKKKKFTFDGERDIDYASLEDELLGKKV